MNRIPALEALQPEDEVFICSSAGMGGKSMARTVVKTVHKIHLTVAAAGDVKFRRKNGHEAGSAGRAFIVPVSPDSEAAYLRHQQGKEECAARGRLREWGHNLSIPIERVRACLAILEAAMPRLPAVTK